MAVTAPMDRELLAASSCAPGKQNSLARTLFSLEQLENDLVVNIRIEIMHSQRVRTVSPDDIFHRYPLTEIGLETIDTHIKQSLKLSAIPVGSFC